MKQIIFAGTLIYTFFSTSVPADPTLFAMESGSTTEEDRKNIYNISHTGRSSTYDAK